jgi:ABC transporter substrate binding protein (PQQ-dependent alcohol dehydrogenase system)
MNRIALSTFALVASLGVARAQTPPATDIARVPIVYVELADDARYEPIRAYGRYVLKNRDHPYDGARVGIDDAKALTRAMRADHQLERVTVKSADEMAAAIVKAIDGGAQFFLVDAPADGFKTIAKAVKGKDALLFNVSAPEDWLRRDLCAAEIVHTMPSRAQLMDGLTQFLISKKWRDYLIFRGPKPEDKETTEAFTRSAKKFGARIIATQDFTPGTDPREREKNNPALLSALNRDWDVTFVADVDDDFAREVSYRTVRPRPVVGATDLEPVAWHWTWDHNGAPQVNTRFSKLAGGRHMDGPDFAAWIAVKIIVQSALRTKSTDFKTRRDFILGPGSFDGDKGEAMSVRPWDHQLRQSVLLAAPFSVVANTPMEGFMHQRDVLDTLGDDEPESPCHLNR